MSIQNTSRGKVYFIRSSVNVRYFWGGGGGVKCCLLNIGVKSVNGWTVLGVKCIFPNIICALMVFARQCSRKPGVYWQPITREDH
jgi:hypothetical protein